MKSLSKSLVALAVVALVVAGLWTGTTALRSSYACLGQDCGALLGERIGEIFCGIS